MTAFEYDNLPDEILASPLPEEFLETALAALNEAVNSGATLAEEVKAVYVYDRKGNISADSLGGPRNPSYSSNTDDVVLQITVRVPNPKTGQGKLVPSLVALEEGVAEAARQAKVAKLEEELAQAEADRAAAAKLAREKRAELDALTAEQQRHNK